MSKQKPANQAGKSSDPPAAPDPLVVAAGSENTPPAHDAPADPTSPPADVGEQPTPSANADGDGEPRRARAVMPDAGAAEAISGFLTDWRADTPAEAAGGTYSPHARDRFAEQDHSAIPDGLVFSKGWVFVFDDGRFVAAADMSSAREDVFVPKGQVIQLSAA